MSQASHGSALQLRGRISAQREESTYCAFLRQSRLEIWIGAEVPEGDGCLPPRAMIADRRKRENSCQASGLGHALMRSKVR